MQPSLEWSESFSVAHPALDAEHRAIMDAIKRIVEVPIDCRNASGLRPLLCGLKEKAAGHFGHEDAILRQIVAFTSSARRSETFLAAMSQALIDDHLVEHGQATIVLDRMIREPLANSSPHFQALCETLTHWFADHAVKHDAHLKTLFQTMDSDCPELLARLD